MGTRHERRDGVVDTEDETRSVTRLRADVPPKHELEDGLPTRVGRFDIEETIGEGGMGRVFLARDAQLGRRVALKLVRPEWLGSAKAVEGFFFEARMTARFSHPHIVTVYDVGEHEGTPYLALEYVEGESLKQRLAREELPSDVALRLARGVADALVEAHAHGVLHRDLKPGNILIGRDGRPRVVDFGLSKRDGTAPVSTRDVMFASRDYTWADAGTPRYMAPEQWRGDASSEATDVWAFGVVMFEMLCGKRPFSGDLAALERAVCSDAPAPRPSLRSVPAEVLDLVVRCLSKAPRDRPTVLDVRNQLDRALRPRAERWRTLRWAAIPGAFIVGVALFAWARPDASVRAPTMVRPRSPGALIGAAPAGAIPSVAASAASTPASVGTSQGAPRKTQAPQPKVTPFADQQVTQHLAARARSAGFSCAQREGPRSFVVSLTWANSGAPEAARTQRRASHMGNSGHCVLAHMRSMSVPPYDGPVQTRTVAVTLP